MRGFTDFWAIMLYLMLYMLYFILFFKVPIQTQKAQQVMLICA